MHRSKGLFAAGFTLGALAGAAGAIVLYKNRKTLKARWWRLRAKADIHRRLGALKEVTREAYDEIVEDVVSRYRTLEAIAAYEADEFAAELKRRFRDVKRGLEDAARSDDRE